MSTADGFLPVLTVTRHHCDSWSATGLLHDGAGYLAVAHTRRELDDRIRDTAAAEQWTGWVTVNA